jgi:hypothetical protein
MKVRVQGNSIRLRLKQEEVAQLAIGQSVEARMEFGPDAASQHLVYRLESGDISQIDVGYSPNCVSIVLPHDKAQGWEKSSEIGFEDSVTLEGGKAMHVLIEKDFKCIDMRPGEGDCYPNPNISC